jgi:hypothetical protein
MPKPPLNAEQANIVRQKQVSLHRPIDDLIGILGPVAQYDAAGDSSRKTLGCTAAIAIVLGVIALFINTIPFHLVVALGLIATGVVLIVVWSRKKSEDISDNLRQCAVPLLVALREDFGSEPIEIKLDLRPPMAKEKQTSKETVNRMTITTYEDPWMSGDGLLHDGSRLRWNVAETIVEKSYWKKGSSGKRKLKTKKKKRVEIEVDLTLRAKTYGVEGDAKKQTMHGEAKRKFATIDPIAPDEIINVIAALYKQAQPAS